MKIKILIILISCCFFPLLCSEVKTEVPINIDLDNYIALFSVVSSIFIAYATTKFTLYLSKRRGKLIIFELIKQYIINFHSSWDFKSMKVKKDDVSKFQYLRTLENIEKQLMNLINNPFYIDLLL